MRNSKALRGLFLILATTLICLNSPSARANGAEVSTTAAEPKPDSNDLGAGLFSRLPFQVSLSLTGGYDDNVTTSEIAPQSSWFTNIGGSLTYNFGDPRTKLSLQLGAAYTYYWDKIRSVGVGNNDYDISTNLGFSLVHKATPRLTLSATGYLTYQTEPDFSLALGSNRRSGNYFYTQDKFSLAYLWTSRFSTATSYTVTAIRYDEQSIAFFEDRIENIFGNEFRFLLWPTTSVVAEYRYQIVTYDSINRDSTTHFTLAGFDHSFSTRLNISFRGGAEFRDYDLGGDRTSPYFEGTLNYAVGKQTSIAWTNRYAIEEPDIVENQSRETFRTGLRLKHDFTARVSGTLGAYYEHDDYQAVSVISPAFTEQSADVALSFRYAITRYMGVEAGYNHTEVWSDILVREYSRNRYWAGFNVVF
jgi:hypothetical protein